MEISFVKGRPALLVRKERALVIADLHIGMEFGFNHAGVYFPGAAKRIAEDLLEAYKRSRAREIVLLGDVKERIGNVTREENDSIRDFFSALDGIRIRIARGNHDAYLDMILERLGLNIEIEKEILLKDVALMHGNMLPSNEAMKKRWLVVGHGHMSAYVNGEVEKVWVIAGRGKKLGYNYSEYNRGIKLVIAPAFNRMITGSSISSESKTHMPLLRKEIFDMDKAKIYNLDGVSLKG